MFLPKAKCSCCKKVETELVYATLSKGVKPRKVWKHICTDCAVKELKNRIFTYNEDAHIPETMIYPMAEVIKRGESAGISFRHIQVRIDNLSTVKNWPHDDYDARPFFMLTASMEDDSIIGPTKKGKPHMRLVRAHSFEGPYECSVLHIMTNAERIIRSLMPNNEYPEGIGTPTSP